MLSSSSANADASADTNAFITATNTTTTTTVPTISSEHHRRVDVETIDDLRALVDAARRAGQEKIDLCLPRLDGTGTGGDNNNSNGNVGGGMASSGEIEGNKETGANGTDELRNMVEEALKTYINNIYDNVLSNISVNGVDAETLYCLDGEGNVISKNGSTTTDEESYEPFDQSLAAKVQSLAEQVEELTADVAAARSTVPVKAAEAFVEGYLAAESAADADDDARVEAAAATAAATAAAKAGQASGLGGAGPVADVEADTDATADELDDIREYGKSFSDPKIRWQDMQATWHRAAGELVGLGGFTETLGRVGRARGVVEEAGRFVAG